MIEKRISADGEEKAVLVAVGQKDQKGQEIKDYLDELAFLAETAGAVTVKRFVQKLPHPDTRTFVGKGKLEEIKKYAAEHAITLIIFDDELNGSQITNI